MQLLDALRIEAKSIAVEIEKSKLFSHMGDRGDYRERVIEHFLRPFLPPCYGAAPGEVFSSDGEQSAQVDIVLYDSVFSTVLFRDGQRMLFPAESIYGSIEVKSNLSTTELKKACENIASVKRLTRQPTDPLDLLPHLHLTLGPGLALSPGWKPCNPYVGVVFGYSGAAPESLVLTFGEEIRAHKDRTEELPDFIFVADPGYVIVRRTTDGRTAFPGAVADGLESIPLGSDTLPILFLTLNICLGEARLRRPDLPALWSQVVGAAKVQAFKNWSDRCKQQPSEPAK